MNLINATASGITILWVILGVLILAVLLVGSAFLALIKFAQSSGVKFLKPKNRRNKKMQSMLNNYNFAKSLVNALTIMGNEKIGALIVVERKDNVDAYGKNGYRISGSFSPEFTMSVFSNKKSALHDGAMIIQENKITTVSAYLPMTKNIIDIKYGARHRAALGMSERTDAIVFVVSETTGLISIAQSGVLTTLERDNEIVEKKVFEFLDINQIDIKE